MVFNERSAIGRVRIVLGIIVVAGFVFGFGIAFFEDSLPEYSALGGVLAVMAIAGVVTYRYYRRLERSGIADERSKQITYKATGIAWSGLLVGLALLASILTFSDFDVPVEPLLWTFVGGSVLVQEVATEFYRRRM